MHACVCVSHRRGHVPPLPPSPPRTCCFPVFLAAPAMGVALARVPPGARGAALARKLRALRPEAAAAVAAERSLAADAELLRALLARSAGAHGRAPYYRALQALRRAADAAAGHGDPATAASELEAFVAAAERAAGRYQVRTGAVRGGLEHGAHALPNAPARALVLTRTRTHARARTDMQPSSGSCARYRRRRTPPGTARRRCMRRGVLGGACGRAAPVGAASARPLRTAGGHSDVCGRTAARGRRCARGCARSRVCSALRRGTRATACRRRGVFGGGGAAADAHSRVGRCARPHEQRCTARASALALVTARMHELASYAARLAGPPYTRCARR